MNIKEPVVVLVNFFNSQLTDPKSRLTSSSQAFTASGIQTDFTLSTTASLISINYVRNGATTASAFLDYNIDLRNQKIVYTSAPATSSIITVNYSIGTPWIAPGYNRNTLNLYPKVVVTQINEVKTPQGVSENDTFDTLTFQIDVLSREDIVISTNNGAIEGAELSEYLARELIKVIKYQWRNNIKEVLFDPLILNNFQVPFDDSKGIYRRLIELKFSAFNAGE